MGVALVLGLVAGLLIDRRLGDAATRDQALARVVARLDAIEAATKHSRHTGATGALPSGRAGLAVDMMGRPLASGASADPVPQSGAAQRQRLQQFQSRFDADAPDASAATAELAMLRAMADDRLIADSSVPARAEVSCRQHGCRVSADFPGTDEAMQWAVEYVTFLGQDRVGNAQPVVATNADGSVRLHLFTSRRGRS